MILNNGFPTLANSPNGIPGGLRKNDIIFNHLQSEEILKHGYVTGSHAKLIGGGAHANGTVVGGKAFAKIRKTSGGSSSSSGGGGGTGGGGNTYISTPKVELKASNAQVKTEETEKVKETDKTLTGAGKLLPVGNNTEYIDLIEIKLNKLERTLNKIKTAAESAFNSFADRVSYTTQEINQLTTNINASKTAASAYQRQANKTITSGKYKLTDGEMEQAYKSGIADKGTYTTFANAKKAYKKKKSKSNKTALNNARKALRKQIRNTLNNGEFEIDSITYDSKAQQKYDKAKTAYDKKKTKKNKKALNKAKKALKNEKIKESLKEKISQYQDWRDKRVDMDEQAAELAEERKQAYVNQFDIQKSFYDEEIRKLEQRNDLMNDWISMNENQGNYISKDAYNQLALNEAAKKTNLLNERTKLQQKLQEAVAGGIAVGSEEYNNMVSQIDDVTKAIQESDTAVAELNKKIRELDYERFTMIQESVSDLADEISFLTDIMSENPMYGEKGSLTEYGIATLGTYAMQYEVLRKQAEEYGKEILKVEDNIKKLSGLTKTDDIEKLGVGGLKENTDRLKELQSAQRSVIKNAYDMRKSIKSLVEDGFKEEINSLKDIISEYTKMLDTQKSEYDYSKKIAEQQEKITSLRRQLAAWGGVDTEEGSAKRQKTAKELRDAEQALEESQEERRISQIKEMLNDLQDEYDKLFNSRTDDITFLINDVLNSINGYQGNIKETLNNVLKDSGLKSSESLGSLIGGLSDKAVSIDESLETGIMITGLLGNDGTSIAGSIGGINNINTGINSEVAKIYKKITEGIDAKISNASDIANGINAVINNGYGSATNSNTTGNTNTGGGGGGGAKKATTTTAKTSTSTLVTRVAKDVNKANDDPLKAKALAYINKKANKAKKARGKYSDVNKKIYDLTGGKVLTADELKALAKTVGVKYNNAKSSGTLYQKLRALKIKGFRIGSKRIPDDDIFWTQEGYGQNELIQRKSDGAMLTRLGKGDMVFNADMTKTLWDFAKNPAPYMDTGTIKAPNVSSNITYGDSNIDITFNLPDVTNAEDFMRTLQKSKKFEQIVQSMTIGQLKGKGTLNKYTTRI